MKSIIAAALLGAATLSALPAVAQVNAREANQQQRINQGVRSGQLTPGEAARDERQQANIHETEARMRARSDGHLTHHQRHRLSHMQRRASRHIYRSKHNARAY